jgi:hypothetical protein
MSDATPLAPTHADRFWPNFTVVAILTPLVWAILEGLTMPDRVVGFYIVSIGAIPIVFAAVVLPGLKLATRGPNLAIRAGAILLALPSAAIVLWGTYAALWLIYLLLTGQL